jgi:hypothetical protein
VTEQYTVDGRWDDDILGYLESEHPLADEIESEYYRPTDPDGEPSERPCQERCERYDGPFSEDGPDRLRHAAGALVYTSMTFDPCDDDELEEDGPSIDAEDRSLEVYDDVKDLEATWNQTRRRYDSGEVTRPR